MLADELAQQFQDDPMLLNEIAWSLVSSVPPEQQNTEIAMRIAKQASSLRGDQDPSTLDTVARIYYQQGNLEEAIAWQKKAVEFAPEGTAGQLQATLEQYESELTPAPTEETEEAAEETSEETEPMEEEADAAPEEEESSETQVEQPDSLEQETIEAEAPAADAPAATEEPQP